ncbi:hypothetical protein BHAOGJBA_0453 [Methylobacterium hispanicum]|jgi:hypothetical protein|uniref:Uncharacterized protein n=1 Tax=Methylobacterium hispanicum TaxID=270350 RepID=A0AAV4ZGA5_9HYPH|nr:MULTISPECIES: hypothetical protein [Methylobacterium]GJD86954.1 hypothetical protein BHAOGJBA_0453 [Methylobacterium hispanicum]
MTNRSTITAALALALGLAASPSFAQTFDPSSASYNRDGTLNVWGAHIDPVGARGGLLGGVGTVVGGVTGAVGGIVGGTVGAAGDVVTGSVAPRRVPGAYTAY